MKADTTTKQNWQAFFACITLLAAFALIGPFYGEYEGITIAAGCVCAAASVYFFFKRFNILK